ncbi:MAG TPA: NUDIX domain-containing protein [Candidatus Sulfotelmatobacter sp.]|nr:NUDIX domain-containing protein [Candidatus Sulfotelmatobacter sp.]
MTGFILPPFPPLSPAEGWQADANAVTAVIVTEDQRFLLQLRDDKPGILLPGHWSCFGGHVESGEAFEAAMRRELMEELAYVPPRLDWLYESVHTLPRARRRRVRNIWYAVPLALADIPRLNQQEGAGMDLFTLAQARTLAHVSPLDICAMTMLAHHHRLYPQV